MENSKNLFPQPAQSNLRKSGLLNSVNGDGRAYTDGGGLGNDCRIESCREKQNTGSILIASNPLHFFLPLRWHVGLCDDSDRPVHRIEQVQARFESGWLNQLESDHGADTLQIGLGADADRRQPFRRGRAKVFVSR